MQHAVVTFVNMDPKQGKLQQASMSPGVAKFSSHLPLF